MNWFPVARLIRHILNSFKGVSVNLLEAREPMGAFENYVGGGEMSQRYTYMVVRFVIAYTFND